MWKFWGYCVLSIKYENLCENYMKKLLADCQELCESIYQLWCLTKYVKQENIIVERILSMTRSTITVSTWGQISEKIERKFNIKFENFEDPEFFPALVGYVKLTFGHTLARQYSATFGSSEPFLMLKIFWKAWRSSLIFMWKLKLWILFQI